jgi:peptidoglycan/xylan/chitin deacetylase (PgdA/CDA1 family)
MIEINWTVGTPELVGRSPVQEAQDIINKARPGDIILLHDGYGLEHNNPHADKSVTVQTLPIIIQKLEAEGYQFITVPQLLDVTPYLN